MLCQKLHDLGYHTLEAENGQIGLDMLKKGEEIHCALVDLNMPVMDGRQFVNSLKTIEDSTNLPIVICTAEMVEEVEHQFATRCNFKGVLSKFMKQQELEDQLTIALA